MILSAILGGAFCAVVVVGLGLVLLFLRAWSHRREQLEMLLMALLTGAVVVLDFGFVLFYLGSSQRTASDGWLLHSTYVSVSSGILSTILLFHFSLSFARIPLRARWVFGGYLLAGAYELALLTGHWWAANPQLAYSSLLGLRTPIVVIHPTWLATSFYVLILPICIASTCLLGYASWQTRREGLATFLGAVVLLGSDLNDSFVSSLGLGVYLTPFGFLLFSFGVGLTTMTRFGVLAEDLDQQQKLLQRKFRELRGSYRDLKQAQLELVKREQLTVVGELAAIVAHEVRNPLGIISNAIAALRKPDVRGEDQHTLLTIVDEENARINRLVTELLHYARPISVQPSLISVQEVFQRSLSLIPGSGVEVELKVDTPIPSISADGGLLRQVFDNLVNNAVEAMHGVGLLMISIQAAQQEGTAGIQITLRDTGDGMDTQVRNKAKTPFFTTRSTGTGLGLAIADRVVELHGGTLKIDSRLGEGTTIRIFLPVSSEHHGLGRRRISTLPESFPANEEEAPLSGPP